MKYILLLLFSLSLHSATAQCSISKKEFEDGATACEAKFEKLYQNVGENNDGDYSNGVQMAYARLLKHWKKEDISGQYGLQVGTSANENSRLVIPRQITINFDNGASLALNASSYVESDGIHVCTFILSRSQIQTLSLPIKNFLIIDNRSGKSYNANTSNGLYSKILAEQVDCLKNIE